MLRTGIAVVGNLVLDTIKKIDAYPEMGMLANIVSIEKAVGGSVPNVLINLAKMQTGIPLTAIGKIGDDEAGDYMLSELQKNGIDTGRMRKKTGGTTGFSDVMTRTDTGERAFFHCRGENATFDPDEIALETLPSRMLHAAYILLLDRFDESDSEYGTRMARFLRRAQALGIETSIDVVSDKSGLFKEKVLPALPYADNAIMNEIEAAGVSGLPARDENGRLLEKNIQKTLELFMQAGVHRRAVIHCPEAGFCLEKSGRYTRVPSFKLKKDYIKGAVGAGDAFCAGCLRAIYKGADAKEMLAFAAAAAACSLSKADSVSGMRQESEIYRMMDTWEMNL